MATLCVGYQLYQELQKANKGEADIRIHTNIRKNSRVFWAKSNVDQESQGVNSDEF